MISNADSTVLIYSTEHIRVKVYTSRGHPLAVTIPLGRLAEADEIVPAVLFLLSDRASYVNGQALVLGDRKGQYSIRIDDQWRTSFEWTDRAAGPSNVEIVDYH